MEPTPPEEHPLNLNSEKFDSEAFVSNLIRKKGLDELVAVEEDMVQNVRRLDSEMQQLVYENYNKFLTATNTVRNMQNAFVDMDNEMSGLSSRMKDISALSESLSNMFDKNRETVRQLTEKSKTIERLQFFVRLPQILQEYIDEKNYKKAVEIYSHAREKLEYYKNVKSMSGIYCDCKKIMDNLENELFGRLCSKIISLEEVLEAGRLLKLSGIADEEIRSRVVDNWSNYLNEDLQQLKDQLELNSVYADILEFVDNGCCTFLTNLSLYISLFTQLFNKPADKADLMTMVDLFMRQLESILIKRFQRESNSRDCALFVKTLDRISRKIAVFSRVLPGLDFSRMNSTVVVSAAQHQISICRCNIRQGIVAALKDELDALIKADIGATDEKEPGTLRHLLRPSIAKLEQLYLVMVKTCLANLLLFNASDINFSSVDPVYFGNFNNSGIFGGKAPVGLTDSKFNSSVFENIVVGSVCDLSDIAADFKATFCTTADVSTSPTAFAGFCLIFGGFLENLRVKHMNYLVDLSQEQFKLSEQYKDNSKQPCGRSSHLHHNHSQKLCPTSVSWLTSVDILLTQLKTNSTAIARAYVETECEMLNAMVVKAMDAVDWSSSSVEDGGDERLHVRPLIKQFLNSIRAVDADIETATTDSSGSSSVKKEQTHDSHKGGNMSAAALRRRATTAGGSSNASSATNLMSYETGSLGGGTGAGVGIVEKLWNDEPLDPYGDDEDGCGEEDGDVDDSMEAVVDQAESSAAELESTTSSAVIAVTASPSMTTAPRRKHTAANVLTWVLAHLVEFRRDPIMAAIVRVCLRRMADCFRERKGGGIAFSELGLQQLQVDCAFLKHYLWQLISDEHLLNSSIEEIVTFAVGHCAQPKLLDPATVRDICERN